MTVRGAFKILLVLLFVYNVCEARGGGGRVSFHGGGRGISLRGIAAKAFISRVGRGTRTGASYSGGNGKSTSKSGFGIGLGLGLSMVFKHGMFEYGRNHFGQRPDPSKLHYNKTLFIAFYDSGNIRTEQCSMEENVCFGKIVLSKRNETVGGKISSVGYVQIVKGCGNKTEVDKMFVGRGRFQAVSKCYVSQMFRQTIGQNDYSSQEEFCICEGAQCNPAGAKMAASILLVLAGMLANAAIAGR